MRKIKKILREKARLTVISDISNVETDQTDSNVIGRLSSVNMEFISSVREYRGSKKSPYVL